MLSDEFSMHEVVQSIIRYKARYAKHPMILKVFRVLQRTLFSTCGDQQNFKYSVYDAGSTRTFVECKLDKACVEFL